MLVVGLSLLDACLSAILGNDTKRVLLLQIVSGKMRHNERW